MRLTVIILCLTFSVGFTTAQAQTMPEVEQQIKTYLEGISYWRFEYAPEDTSFGYEVNKEDSIFGINEALFNYLETTVVRVPGILKRPPRLPENSDMSIVTSDDKKISIYSWDAHIGTKQLYNSVGLFDAGGGKVAAKSLGHIIPKDTVITPGHRFVEVLNITEKGTTYYLLISTINFTEASKQKDVMAFTINDKKLEAVKLFIQDGHKSYDVGYLYDYMSNYDFEKMKEINTIHLSKNKKKLYIPEVEHNQMTGKWQVYVFDGTNFVYDENAK